MGRTRPVKEFLVAFRPIGRKVVELRGWGAEQGLSVRCFFRCRAEETPVLPRGQGASPTLRGPCASSQTVSSHMPRAHRPSAPGWAVACRSPPA